MSPKDHALCNTVHTGKLQMGQLGFRGLRHFCAVFISSTKLESHYAGPLYRYLISSQSHMHLSHPKSAFQHWDVHLKSGEADALSLLQYKHGGTEAQRCLL